MRIDSLRYLELGQDDSRGGHTYWSLALDCEVVILSFTYWMARYWIHDE